MGVVLSLVFNVEFKIISQVQLSYQWEVLDRYEIKPGNSLRTNSTTCEENCSAIDGHLPCLYDVDSVLTQLFENKTINATAYSIFREMRRFSSGQDLEFTFRRDIIFKAKFGNRVVLKSKNNTGRKQMNGNQNIPF